MEKTIIFLNSPTNLVTFVSFKKKKNIIIAIIDKISTMKLSTNQCHYEKYKV